MGTVGPAYGADASGESKRANPPLEKNGEEPVMVGVCRMRIGLSVALYMLWWPPRINQGVDNAFNSRIISSAEAQAADHLMSFGFRWARKNGLNAGGTGHVRFQVASF